MAKAKIINISGPMDVKHVGGVNLITITGKSKPAGLPTRPIFPTAPMGAPTRSNTLPSSMQRPGLSSSNSVPIMRTESLRQFTETRRRIENDQYPAGPDSTSVPAPPSAPLQPSMSIRRKKIGHERAPSEPTSTFSPSDSESEVTPAPTPAPAPTTIPLQPSLSIRRKNIAHERYPSEPVPVITLTDSEPETAPAPAPATVPIQPTMPFRRPGMGHQRNPSAPVAIFVAPQPEPEPVPDPSAKDLLRSRSRNPLARFAFNTQQQEPTFPAAAPAPIMRWPTRPKRADSGTAIDIDNVPAQERPVPFKEIQAVQSFEDRMAMYKKSRDYWATANHGLAEWTQRLTGARLVAAQV